MEKTKAKNAYMKKIIALIVPIICLIVTVSVAGVSYAWFSKTAVAEITPLVLNTKEVFDLTFNNVSNVADKYIGQNAYDNTGHLITSRWAVDRDNGGKGLELDSTQYKDYIINAPYISKALLALDTDGMQVDFNIKLSNFEIWNREYPEAGGPPTLEKKEYPVEGSLVTSSDDVSLLGTWYMKKQGGTTIYTPYGAFDQKYMDNPIANGFPWTQLPAKQDVKDFYAQASERYEFYIVFAPEKLFWLQFCSATGVTLDGVSKPEWVKTLSEIYTAEERAKICDPSNKNNYKDRPFYATRIYIGRDFEFTVELKVTRLEGETV